MIKIGDFAKIFDVTVKTIRFYESKGLLNPAYVDIYSGYRYYDDQNILEMSKIMALKDLGLELSEIKNLDELVISDKIKFYENKIKDFSNNIHILKTLSKNEGGMKNLKTFINDEKAIGKWCLEGVYEKKEDYPNNKSDFEIGMRELYLMPKGENYWVISWTKDIIYINGRENKYEIIDDKMFVYLVDPFDSNDYKVAVYKRMDNHGYSIEEIERKDNIDVEFIKDSELIGFWKCIDFIDKKDSNFDKTKSDEYLAIKQIIVSPDDKVIVDYGVKTNVTKYTKGYIINLCLENTLCAYEYRVINGTKYMVIEWKSGDYVFGNMINGYYVLEKVK